MARKNSRLARVEHQRNVRTTIRFVVLSIILIVILFFFGLPALAKFSSFLINLGQGTQPIEISDKTPPAPPQFDLLPDFTNKTNITVEGTAESGATVIIFYNGSEKETVVDDDGRFTISVPLNKGENNLYSIATDQAGNKSTESKNYIVTYDDKAPVLTINEPANGASFSGNENNLKITGTTDSEAQVTVNDRLAVVNSDGSFEISFTLNTGENIFEIRANDKAGNETVESISVTYQE